MNYAKRMKTYFHNAAVYITLVAVICMNSVTPFSCPESIAKLCSCYTKQIHKSGLRQVHHYVDCSSREFFKVPFFDFPEGTKLRELRLQNNSILSLSSNDFHHPIIAERVDISRNPVGNSLPDAFFSTVVRNVQAIIAREIGLDLQNVSSLAFTRNAFSLQELDLSRNWAYGVDMLPALFIDNNIHSLQNLSLSSCRIRRINAHAFIGLVHLHVLDLSQNFLAKVPKAINRLSLLRKLNLSENDITVLRHGDFSELHCLQELDLSKNLLGQLEAFRNGALFGIGNSLTHLYLHDAHLTNIPSRMLSELNILQHLDLSSNKISVMTNNSFKGKYSLVSLDISDNPWIIDARMFHGVGQTLRVLRMRRAGLNYIPTATLQYLQVLEELDLSFNSLLSINSKDLHSISARRLLFRGNKIHFISPDAFSHYKRPVDVDISRNELSTLDFIFESEKCTFYKVNITSNGFLCDCNIEKLISSRRTHILDGDCALKSGVNVSFNNAIVEGELEKQCGVSDSSYCIWWIKNNSEHVNELNIRMFIILIMLTLLTV
ncbi:toll-like receptor 6 [Mya arenaria]|uniref:toll-like receptor 6 n=1 Tax=Mya arenaria TaxID=6604 RepID=UPI0022DF8200|nr:toll-like receptor 6 [Mya arenaria]